ncbi:MAG: Trp biosynthesis-associated membrane protein [Actinobacteria bacterium]|nr:Trp biosynthesis-associated membrane protein [Actinomycetota bacterium]MDA3003088.1 Trp biosynthesis-associated membrane protein [Actinomycetota bacterium]
MRRLFHLFALSGLLLAAFGSATTWWIASLASGAAVDVSGTTASALLWSVGAVVLAAYGLQFTLRGIARRVTAVLQAAGGIGFSAVALSVAANPLSSALEGITAATGVAGSNALLLVDAVEMTGWHFSAVVAGILLATSGVLGGVMGDRATTSDRFDRHSPSGSLEDSVSAWDSLSDGTDPTQR